MQGAIIENIYERTNNFSTQTGATNNWIDKAILSFQTRRLFHFLKKKAKKIDYSNYIEKNNDICNGEAVIKGTRIKPITIYNYWFSNKKKYKNFDLYFEDIKKAYPALDDEKTLYAWLYCIKNMSLNKFLK